MRRVASLCGHSIPESKQMVIRTNVLVQNKKKAVAGKTAVHSFWKTHLLNGTENLGQFDF